MRPFNGATAFQRWKLQRRRTPSRRRPHPSMGPPPFSDGSHATVFESHTVVCPSMGPPPFSDGNSALERRHLRSYGAFNGATAFQRWKLDKPLVTKGRVGQTFNGATAFQRWKLEKLHVGSPDIRPPSMGPPPFSDGNYCPSDADSTMGPPSMGPPPFSDGNRPAPGLNPLAYLPSMGPPPFSDGNDGRQDQGKGLHPPSMEPPPFSDGNLVLLLNLDTLGVPSMGPPPFSDGNPTKLNGSTFPLGAFNGATAFQRWKQSLATYYFLIVDHLQWGHRLSAMETIPGHLLLPDCRPPSMGPPPFSDGNPRNTPGRRRSSSTLQWGHRLSAMETGSDISASAIITSLQWGHRLSAMETTSPAVCCSARWTTFNGATAFQRWKQLRRLCVVRRVGPPSMGPPPFSDGNNFAGCVLFGALDHLQWGHRLSAMETTSPAVCCSARWTTFNGATAFQRWKLEESR